MEKMKGPEFRIVGDVSEKLKQEAKEELTGFFGENHLGDTPEKSLEQLKKLEYSKTLEEIELINFANQKSNELMEKCGVQSYDVPIINLHIVPPELYKEIADKEGIAATFQQKQAIAMNADKIRKNLIFFGQLSFHELLHLKSHFALEVEEGSDKNGVRKIIKNSFRQGVSVLSSKKDELKFGEHKHFKGLNEAIVASQEKKFIDALLDLPMFEKDKQRMNSEEFFELRKKISKEKNIPIEEIYWVDKNSKEFNTFSYSAQRRVFEYLIDEIRKDTEKPEEEIRLEFLKSQFNGKLLSIAHLVEETFGKGSFRLLGNMSDDRESAVLCLEALRKMRINKNK